MRNPSCVFRAAWSARPGDRVIFCRSCARISWAVRRSAEIVFSMIMSLGWLYMRAQAQNTGAVIYENKGKDLRHMILQTCL